MCDRVYVFVGMRMNASSCLATRAGGGGGGNGEVR